MAIKIIVEIPIAKISSTNENPVFEYKWIVFCPTNCRLLQRTDEMTICRLKFNLLSTPPGCARLSKIHQVFNQIRLDCCLRILLNINISQAVYGDLAVIGALFDRYRFRRNNIKRNATAVKSGLITFRWETEAVGINFHTGR